jgi:hypothetical protein
VAGGEDLLLAGGPQNTPVITLSRAEQAATLQQASAPGGGTGLAFSAARPGRYAGPQKYEFGGGVRSERPERELFKLGELMKAIHVAASSAERVALPEERGAEVWLANASLTGASLSVIRLLLRPGQSGGRHCHPNADEVICLFRSFSSRGTV